MVLENKNKKNEEEWIGLLFTLIGEEWAKQRWQHSEDYEANVRKTNVNTNASYVA